MNSDKKRGHLRVAELLRRVEDRLKPSSTEVRSTLTHHERIKFHHELQVHRLELEMQNAELRQSCDDLETALAKCTTRLHDVLADTTDKSSLTGGQIMSTREAFIRRMQAKLEEWNAEIDTLSAKAEKVSADVSNDYHRRIDSLKAKQGAAREKIEELQQAGENAWEDLKSGTEMAWTAMGEAIDSAKNRFK
jgi:prefoldin subunit 5